ncbi:hypothetical protein [Streptococcus ovis]|uniref:hypothetical protein n=1 Tax=Streptococcus ovis TaxID=82806 RepID=UPI00035DC785|nr:hypothetical protein [Streptococcus ovis]
MKRETLKLKDDFLGIFIYEGLGDAPRYVDGKQGNYQRHLLLSEKHGVVHVITEASADVIPFDSEVKLVDALFYPDRNLNGRNVAPAMNVLAKKIEIVKGGTN